MNVTTDPFSCSTSTHGADAKTVPPCACNDMPYPWDQPKPMGPSTAARVVPNERDHAKPVPRPGMAMSVLVSQNSPVVEFTGSPWQRWLQSSDGFEPPAVSPARVGPPALGAENPLLVACTSSWWFVKLETSAT